MLLWKLLFITLAMGGAYAFSKNEHKQETGCVVPIGNRDLYRFQWPLVYTKAGELYKTNSNGEQTRIEIQPNEEVILSCGPNYFKHFFRKESTSAQCNGATGNFTVNNKEWSIEDLACDLRIIEEIITTVEGCPSSKYTAVHFGYVDPNEKVTHVMGEACYDTIEGRTIFAHVKSGKDKYSRVLSKPAANYLTSSRHPDGRYKIELFRGLQFDSIYERLRVELKTRKIPQLKMSNYIDEYFFGNLQYQPIKKLSWNYYVGFDDHVHLETLKSDIQRLSEKVNLNIYTGSHGVKTFKGENDKTLPLYLHPNRFPMPELIWFVVEPEEGDSIAFAVANNAADGNAVESSNGNLSGLCPKSDCHSVSWLSANLQNAAAASSSIVCCSINELRKNIPEIPLIPDAETMDLLF